MFFQYCLNCCDNYLSKVFYSLLVLNRLRAELHIYISEEQKDNRQTTNASF